MSQYVASSLDTKFVYDNWKLHSSAVSMETTTPLVQILTVIGKASKSLAKVAREDMRGECLLAVMIVGGKVAREDMRGECLLAGYYLQSHWEKFDSYFT